MNTRLFTVVFLGAACSGDKDDTAGGGETDADTDADTDSDTDADTDADTDSDTDFFLKAKGTLDGKGFEVNCPPGFMVTTRGGTEKTGVIVGAICAETSGATYSVAITAIDVAVADITKCSATSFIQVTEALSGASFGCLTGGATAYDMDVTEVSDTTDATIWAGTFSMTGDNGTHSADLTGSFRVRSASPGGDDGGT